ncbi:MAG: putative rane protein [Gemmatimonadetes bacterium]|nr:putative rane protein [Gemmatimonadota bacterium]
MKALLPVLPLLLLPVLMIACFAIHELGHVVAGAFFGRKVVLFIAGPLQLLRVEGRLRMGLNRVAERFGGMALSVPDEWRGSREYVRSTRWMLAGGPLASVALGVVMLGFPLASSGWHARALVNSPPLFLLFTLGAMSVAIGIATAAPGMFTRRGTSDGARLRSVEPLDALSAISQLLHLRRPREWNEELVGLLMLQLSQAACSRGHVLLHRRALDLGHHAEATSLLDTARLVAECEGASHARAVAVDEAIHLALWQSNPLAARDVLAGAGIDMASMGDGTGELRVAFAAVRLAEGQLARAQASIELLAQDAWDGLSPGLFLSHAATLDRMRERATLDATTLVYTI